MRKRKLLDFLQCQHFKYFLHHLFHRLGQSCMRDGKEKVRFRNLKKKNVFFQMEIKDNIFLCSLIQSGNVQAVCCDLCAQADVEQLTCSLSEWRERDHYCHCELSSIHTAAVSSLVAQWIHCVSYIHTPGGQYAVIHL